MSPPVFCLKFKFVILFSCERELHKLPQTHALNPPPIWPWLKGWDPICLETEEPRKYALISFFGNLSEDEDKSLHITTSTLSSTGCVDNYLEIKCCLYFFKIIFLLCHLAEGIYWLILHFERERLAWKVSLSHSFQRVSPSIMTVLAHHTHSIYITLLGLSYRQRLIVIFALCSGT